MTSQQMAILGFKIVALTMIMFLCFAIAGDIAEPPGGSTQTPAEQGNAALLLLLVCFLNTVILALIILHSRWTGWKLMAAIFVICYGIMTVMGQIESAVFITRLPPGMVPRLFLMGAVVAAPFSVLAVLILGKRRPTSISEESNQRLSMPLSEWAGKLAILVTAYVILYFTFGYFIAWQNPAVRAYYGGTDHGNFFAQMGATFREQPWLLPLQILRGFMWVALAVPVIRMLRAGRWGTALTLGLLFAVLMNAQLLLPNPYMPESVRLSHLLETASSNFIFGVLVGGLLFQSEDASLAVAASQA